jgi:histidinol-phosphate aminotransferase
MKNIQKLVRSNILKLKPYSSARDEFSGKEGIFLDANENPYGDLNRYPDPYQSKLKEKIAELKSIPINQIFVGNGSDEVIDLMYRIFCEPAKDKVIICPPTYGMYEVSANINDIEITKIPLTQNFQVDVEKVIEIKNAKILFLCSPNNPTGNILKDVEKLIKKFEGIVVVDEAYIDFSEAPSFITKLNLYPNLVVMQTFSKALGLAGARVGMAFSSTEIIALMNKVKPPYNVSKPNQDIALKQLENQALLHTQKEKINAQKVWLKNALAGLSIVLKIYPSDANFLLLEVKKPDDLYQYLIEQKVIVRNRNSVVKNCIRITIGKEHENKLLINAIKDFMTSTSKTN